MLEKDNSTIALNVKLYAKKSIYILPTFQNTTQIMKKKIMCFMIIKRKKSVLHDNKKCEAVWN